MPHFTADDLIDQLERWYLTPADYDRLNALMCELSLAHIDTDEVPENFVARPLRVTCSPDARH